jgi:signal transduction histidine kinase/ActR/RegA family two-component response regulator
MTSVPLRRRLFLLAAAAILPLAVTSAIALYAVYRQAQQQAHTAGLEIARALSTAVDGELQRTISVLDVLATSVRLESGDLRGFHQRARTYLQTQPHWRAIVLTDAQGTPLLNTQQPFGAELPALIETQSIEPVVRTRKPVVGYLTKGPRGSFAFAVRVPVMKDGALRYVLTAVVEPSGILTVINRQPLPRDWVVAIGDARGIRVARTRSNDESLGTPFSPSLAAMMSSGSAEGAGITHSSEGEPVYTAYSRSRETGWFTAVGLPTTLVDAGVRRSFAAFGGGILLSTLLAVAAALAIARSINRPMRELRQAALAMGDGASPAAPVTKIREIQVVAHALLASAEQREDLLRREQAARAVAEAANRSKDEFLAMLGHELRNPLSAIANAASLLENAKADASILARARAIIARQVSHLTRLTDDLLDAGRALMGKIVLQPQPLDLAAVARQSLATLAASGRTARHAIEERLEPAWTDADSIRLEQIISNLVVNAVKYTPEGGTVCVSVKREGAEAVLRVADTGIGLSPELAGRVFELFVQGDRELDRSQGGLGIGLTLVRRLAEMHGGTASAYSEGPGKGSEFTVRLPAIEPRGAAPPLPARAQVAAARDILIVEDNDDARETLRILLEMEGHRVETAGDGLAGLEKALALQPEVALIDVGLPKLDGYEVARRLRATAGIRQPFLVALTGYGLPEDRQRAFDAGFDAHVVKPVDRDTLSEVLATSSSGRPESAPP